MRADLIVRIRIEEQNGESNNKKPKNYDFNLVEEKA